MRYLIATDSFKGCLSSAEAGQAMAEGVRLAVPGAEVECLTLSDGGEGMAEAFAEALHAHWVTVSVHDAMMRRVTARYAVAPDGTAVIETAEACGLALVAPEHRNPLVATTYGVGELVADAVRRGCRRILIGLGGSATSDAGIGMLRALTDAFAHGGTIDDALTGALAGCRFTLASDVRAPLCGPEGAAYTFAPQKGATPEMVEALDRRARRFAEHSARHFGRDCSTRPGAGAAGGLGYAFMQYLGADCRSGADLLLDLLHFDRRLGTADRVITGEGSADRQTLMGKLPERVLAHARRHHVPVWLVAGRVADGGLLRTAGFAGVTAINPPGAPAADCLRPDVARQRLCSTVARLCAADINMTSSTN